MDSEAKKAAWDALSKQEKDALEARVQEVATRFKETKRGGYNDCMDGCREMGTIIMNGISGPGGPTSAEAHAAEEAVKGCYDECHESHGIPHG